MLFKWLPGYDTIWTWPCSAAATLVSAVTNLLGQFDVQLDRSFAVYLPNSSYACCHRRTAWQEFGCVLTRRLLGLLSPHCSASLMHNLAEFGRVLTWWLFCLLSQNRSASLTYNLTGVWLWTYLTALVSAVAELLSQFDVQLGRSLTVYLRFGSSAQNCSAILTYNLAWVWPCTPTTALAPAVTEPLCQFDIQLSMSLAMCSPDNSCAYCYRTARPAQPAAQPANTLGRQRGAVGPRRLEPAALLVPAVVRTPPSRPPPWTSPCQVSCRWSLTSGIWSFTLSSLFDRKGTRFWCTPYDSLSSSLPPNSAVFGYAIEVALLISTHLWLYHCHPP